jgi:hypothetical protein
MAAKRLCTWRKARPPSATSRFHAHDMRKGPAAAALRLKVTGGTRRHWPPKSRHPCNFAYRVFAGNRPLFMTLVIPRPGCHAEILNCRDLTGTTPVTLIGSPA